MWWGRKKYKPPQENEMGYKSVEAEITFKRNIWTANERPLHDIVFVTVAGWGHPRTIYHDEDTQEALYWRSLMDRMEGKA